MKTDVESHSTKEYKGLNICKVLGKKIWRRSTITNNTNNRRKRCNISQKLKRCRGSRSPGGENAAKEDYRSRGRNFNGGV